MNEEDFYSKEEDLIEIILKICPSSYFQATKDQEALLQQKKTILAAKEVLLNKL